MGSAQRLHTCPRILPFKPLHELQIILVFAFDQFVHVDVLIRHKVPISNFGLKISDAISSRYWSKFEACYNVVSPKDSSDAWVRYRLAKKIVLVTLDIWSLLNDVCSNL